MAGMKEQIAKWRKSGAKKGGFARKAKAIAAWYMKNKGYSKKRAIKAGRGIMGKLFWKGPKKAGAK